VDDEGVDDAPALDDDELELDDPPHAAATDSTAASMTTHNDLRISITPLIAGRAAERLYSISGGRPTWGTHNST
jgi:hypothetical protein